MRPLEGSEVDMTAMKATEELRREVEARLKAGESRASISRGIGMNPKTLARWIEQWADEKPRRVKELNPAEIQSVREMLDQGMGVRQITLQLWRDRKRSRTAA